MNYKNLSNTQAIIFLILAQSMIAVNIVSSKYLLVNIPTLVLIAMRFFFATLLSLPLYWLIPINKSSLRYDLSQISSHDWLFILAQALCAGLLFNSLMMLGLRDSDANVAGIITSAMPAIIAVFSCWFLGEKLSIKIIICILLACIGLAIIACDKLQGVAVNHTMRGDLLILASMIPEAAYYILAKIHRNHLPVFIASSLINGINALILLCFLPFIDMSSLSIHLGDSALIFVISVSSVLFYVFWFLGCQQLNGIVASLSTLAMPIMTVILAWLFLGEQLSIIQGAGMMFVVLSIFVYAKR